ncbi:LysR family transcriptional regulator [Lysobacter cavernae]|uniref:LysR family transcriptional regulator n=1 Tax=Lysobacter cavernae TaxID=1685901 RepID=A0ABV7RSS8_9GAMM
MGPDFKRLSVFRTVVNSGGVNAAARVLHKSPSAVTYDLQQLERQLGASLFRKSGRRLVLTPRGRALAASIERAYLDLQQAWEGLGDANGREPLRIACVSGFGRYRLVPRLMRMMPPERPVEVLFRTASEVQALLESGRVALGVSYRPLVTAGIVSTPLAEEELVLVGPKTRRAAPRPEDIPKLPFVTYEEFDYVFFRWFEANGLPLPQPWHRVDHFDELEEALESVASGRGWSIVPLDSALGRAYGSRLRVHRPRRHACINDIHLVGSEHELRGEDAALLMQAAKAG